MPVSYIPKQKIKAGGGGGESYVDMELGLRICVSKFRVRYIPEHCKPSELSINLKKKKKKYHSSGNAELRAPKRM